MFSARTSSPSYVVDVAAATRALVEHGEPGLYTAWQRQCTWARAALEAARILGREATPGCPVLAADVPLPPLAAIRRAFNAKLRSVTPIPSWRDALERYIKAKTTGHKRTQCSYLATISLSCVHVAAAKRTSTSCGPLRAKPCRNVIRLRRTGPIRRLYKESTVLELRVSVPASVCGRPLRDQG